MVILVALVVAMTGCRIGFDSISKPSIDAGPTSDAFDTWDASLSCQKPAPFLYLIDTHELSPSLLEATWCSAGLPGPLTATLFVDQTLVVREQYTVPITDNRVEFLIGGAGCTCITRLQANGVTVDGPPTFYSGD